MLLVVNYHYIGEENTHPYPGIYPTPVARLEKQLDVLGSYFSFVSQQDIVSAMENGKSLPDRACLITFDDGLKEQYEKALPILQKRNIPCIFFVNGLPYDENKALQVHKIHWCLSHLAPVIFLEKLKERYAHLTGQDLDINAFQMSERELSRHYHYGSLEETRIKFILDKGFLEPDIREKIVNMIFSEPVPDEPAFCGSFYMTEGQLKHLYDLGYLGIHTYSHKPLGLCSFEICQDEVGRCLKAVSSALGVKNPNIYSVSYPYGGSEVVPLYISDMASQAGLRLGFTMERSFNKGLSRPFLLGRVDTNDAPGGKSPYFKIQTDEVVIINDAMHMFRQDHFAE